MKGPAMRRQPIRSLLVTLGFVLGSGAIGPASHASAAQDKRAAARRSLCSMRGMENNACCGGRRRLVCLYELG
ncbi:hypothetical protein ABWH91_15095 [Phycisphaerales bacterium ac7]